MIRENFRKVIFKFVKLIIIIFAILKVNNKLEKFFVFIRTSKDEDRV